ncbi:MAG: DUF805 domain-containing protein [Bacteroides sp.]|nr:DUF805 domain-containing protein [Roseburia sp.]MCM1347381.1 DUF805 domain-containing protein [Bacteroides sp.]MCM1421856.1 DUF805 domain-containing protein [Bacteroides sp.]
MIITEIKKAPSMMECVKLFFKNYVNFDGRSRRAECWKYCLFNLIVYIPFDICYGILIYTFVTNPRIMEHPEMLFGAIGVGGLVLIFVYMLYGLACFLPGIAIIVRRLHDIGLSGYYAFLMLLSIIPFINWLVSIAMIVLMCIDSKPETNEYGPSVKYITQEEDTIQAN